MSDLAIIISPEYPANDDKVREVGVLMKSRIVPLVAERLTLPLTTDLVDGMDFSGSYCDHDFEYNEEAGKVWCMNPKCGAIYKCTSK